MWTIFLSIWEWFLKNSYYFFLKCLMESFSETAFKYRLNFLNRYRLRLSTTFQVSVVCIFKEICLFQTSWWIYWHNFLNNILFLKICKACSDVTSVCPDVGDLFLLLLLLLFFFFYQSGWLFNFLFSKKQLLTSFIFSVIFLFSILLISILIFNISFFSLSFLALLFLVC